MFLQHFIVYENQKWFVIFLAVNKLDISDFLSPKGFSQKFSDTSDVFICETNFNLAPGKYFENLTRSESCQNKARFL